MKVASCFGQLLALIDSTGLSYFLLKINENLSLIFFPRNPGSRGVLSWKSRQEGGVDFFWNNPINILHCPVSFCSYI